MSSLPLIEIVKRQAIASFSKVSTSVSSNFEENLTKLKNVMNKVTSADLNLDPNLLLPGSTEITGQAPVTYIEVLDHPDLTIGIFVLSKGARLPLHDHPLMYGVLKVVYGTVHIQSYSVINSNKEKKYEEAHPTLESVHPSDIGLTQDTLHRQISLVVRKEPAVFVSESDNVCVLSPISGNLHEIHSVNGPAAFLDVLSPPYETDIEGVGPRPCRYFKELEDVILEKGSERSPLKRLLRVPSPPDYWSSSAPYQGP